MSTGGFPDWNINSLIPIGNNTLDAFGSLWWIDGLVEGWDSPDMRMTMLPKIGNDPSSDGETAGDLHYRGRSMVIKLVCASPSEAARENSQLLLAQALDLTLSSGRTGTFFVNEVVPKQLNIQRAGNTSQGKLTMASTGLAQQIAQTPGFSSLTGQVYMSGCTVEMYAADPRKYAQTPQTISLTTGTGTFTAVGNTATQNMKLTLATSGGAGPITIAVGGKNMRILKPTVPSGGPTLNNIPAALIIDVYNKTITDGSGVNYFYLRDLTTPWLQIPSGANTMTVSPTPARASSLVFSDAWI